MKKGIALFLTVCMLAGVTGCGDSGQKKGEAQHPVYSASMAAQDYVKENPSAEENRPGNPGDALETEQMRDGINKFAFHMYEQAENGENMFFSPYSLCSALAMLNVAADDVTEEELEQMLGITDADEWNREMKAYLEKKWSDDTYVLTANSLWMQKDYEWAENVKTDVLQPLGYFYNSELYETDFKGDPDTAKNGINGWVKDHTKGMIPEIINQVPDDTVLALLNAVYFEGKWEIPFVEDDTYEQTFYGTSGEKQTEMMHMSGEHFRYAEYNGITGISIPYKDSSVVMKVYMPTVGTETPGEWFGSMSDEERQALLDCLDTASYEKISNLTLPKFTLEKTLDNLPALLQQMGMVSAFGEGADFEKLGKDLYVTDVLHKAKVIVDEQGTKAAAVTAIMVETMAVFVEDERIEFVADRPFLFVLQDTETGIVLFMGQFNTVE